MLDWETMQISSLRRNPLDEEPSLKQNQVSLEITINHPRTKPFERMSKDRQISLLNSLYYAARASIETKIIEDSVRHELCKDGHVHLHAYIIIEVPSRYIPQGIVMRAVRSIIQKMPVRTHAQLTNYHYCSQYFCFKSPAVLVQLTKDEARLKKWDTYINKST